LENRQKGAIKHIMQDLEALWSVLFFVPGQPNLNAGVVIFETGRVFGGDSWYYYTGTYKSENGKLTATLTSTHYAGPMGSPSMGMRREGTYLFKEIRCGQDDDGNRTIDVTGTVVEVPAAPQVLARLTWRARLPG
jgi:hypothetical protein